MGIYDRAYAREGRGGLIERSPYSVVTILIGANVALFLLNLLLSTTAHPAWFTSDVMALSNGYLFKPWRWYTLLSYGFAHSPSDIRHLLFNMLGLYFFGRTIEERLGRGEFLRFYLAAVVLGGLVWAVRLQLASPGMPASVVGASGAVVATLTLFCFINPRATILLGFFIPVPAWLCGVFLIIENMWGALYGRGALDASGATAFDVHLAGAAFAASYFYFHWNLTRAFGRFDYLNPAQLFQRRTKLRVHRPSEETNYEDMDREGDRILQKLHELGESSLSARERNILEAYSRRMRQKHR